MSSHCEKCLSCHSIKTNLRRSLTPKYLQESFLHNPMRGSNCRLNNYFHISFPKLRKWSRHTQELYYLLSPDGDNERAFLRGLLDFHAIPGGSENFLSLLCTGTKYTSASASLYGSLQSFGALRFLGGCLGLACTLFCLACRRLLSSRFSHRKLFLQYRKV